MGIAVGVLVFVVDHLDDVGGDDAVGLDTDGDGGNVTATLHVRHLPPLRQPVTHSHRETAELANNIWNGQ